MRTKSRVKLALTFAASQFHSRTTETCLFDAITSLFPLRNNMSTTTKLLKNSRWFEFSNRKAPGTLPKGKTIKRLSDQTFKAWSTAGRHRHDERRGEWWR